MILFNTGRFEKRLANYVYSMKPIEIRLLYYISANKNINYWFYRMWLLIKSNEFILRLSTITDFIYIDFNFVKRLTKCSHLLLAYKCKKYLPICTTVITLGLENVFGL